MMKDIEIKISRETRMVDLSKTTIGNDGENLQGNLVFSFTDEFVKGQGRLEYIINGESKYAFLLNGDENYYIPIKSVMTKEGQIDMQLVITEGTDTSEIPIFKSNVFYVSCKKSINAEVEEEEGYYSWIEIANTKLNEVDEAIEELASQSNYAKEQGDYAKEQGTNAKNIAEETEKKAEEGKFNGKSLEFVWQGTKLGVRLEGQEAYQFVDLQGVQGEIGATGEPFKIKKTYASVSEMNADFRNMVFGDYVMIASSVDVEDNAKLYTRGESAWIFISDFSGAMGIRGETGLTPNIKIGEVKTLEAGSQAKVTRSGSNEEPVFNFELPKGDKGDNYVLTEEDKVEIGEKVNTEYEQRITKNEKYISDLEATIDILTNTNKAKGELVHITDALPLPTFETKTSGNVEQETTKGYNLITTEYIPSPGFGTPNTKLLKSGTYTLAMCDKNPFESPVYIKLWKNGAVVTTSGHVTNVNNWNISGFSSTTYNYYGSVTSTTNFISFNMDDDYELEITVLNASGTRRVTLVSGETPIYEYEPFTNGASPNPEYPQEIEVIEGDLSFKVNGKNILSLDMFRNGIVPSISSGLDVNSSGMSSTSFIEINNTLPLYLTLEGLFPQKYVFLYDKDYNFIRYFSGLDNNYVSEIYRASDYKNTKYIKIRIDGNVSTITKAQLEYNEVATEIEDYQEQIVPLDLKGNFVGAINDTIKDYLVTDKKKLWLVKNVGKVVLDGSETYTDISIRTNTIRCLCKLTGGVSYTSITSHLIYRNNIYSSDIEGQLLEKNYLVLSLPISIVGNTSNALKTWLSNNNIEVYYQLAEPQIIDLGELPEPIRTFEGINNIQVLANLDTEIEVKYALDVKKYVDNKLASIQEQIL